MPELPEVEVLARHLRPAIQGKTIRRVTVLRPKVIKPTSLREFQRVLSGARFQGLRRRGKYLLFDLKSASAGKPVVLLGHLGMTGRMFLAPKSKPLPKHAAIVFDFGSRNFIYEDTRYFGRMTLNVSAIARLGPEPLGDDFQPATFSDALKRSRQAIKVKLLDQALVAGVGNIYASEALFRARISPRLAANRLTRVQVKRLRRKIRDVLSEAIECGSTLPLNFSGKKSDGLFYFGKAPEDLDYYEERLRVYDRAGKPCLNCGQPVRRIVQAARSTFFCPRCQIA